MINKNLASIAEEKTANDDLTEESSTSDEYYSSSDDESDLSLSSDDESDSDDECDMVTTGDQFDDYYFNDDHILPDESEEDDDSEDEVELEGHGGLFNYTRNCYANASMQVVARTPELSMAFNQTYDENEHENSVLKETCRIIKAINLSMDTHTIKLCRKLGFKDNTYAEPDEFLSRLIENTKKIDAVYPQPIITALGLENSNQLTWSIIVNPNDTCDQFDVKQTPEVFIIQIARRLLSTKYSVHEFKIHELIKVNEKDYKIYAGILHIAGHFVSVVGESKYDDEKKPIEVRKWINRSYFKKKYMHAVLQNV